ncbi:MAG: hypothetical protein N4A48_10410 [Tepidibacter sp.]|jgi:hypothetical protein|uniref:hypothetical protein n=1 Tax=Tepidibacter sp. TaxID=2529387 RepID=UPI0025E21EFF|nr:hypothetical protein [Tepidibacter sp.]MCT4509145.1 hypothetical protein [Tepidibacter sp.]
MFVVFKDDVIDSKDIKKIILDNSEFNILEDMSLRSKREDVVAFNMSINIHVLNEMLKDDGYDIEEENKEELLDEYMDLADTLAVELEEYMPERTILKAYAYKYDELEDSIKLVFAMSHRDMGELKLSDIVKRLLSIVG